MNYRSRNAERKLSHLARHLKVVLVTGARQVGKSTLLTHVFPEYKAVVFDPLLDVYGVRSDPDLFLSNFPAPLVLDEIQFVPELLSAIKRWADRSERTGQYLMTGSQNLGVLKTVSESLAGRVGVLSLDGMTVQELANRGGPQNWLSVYLESPDDLPDRVRGTYDDLRPLSRFLWRGGMPGLLDKPDDVVPDYFSAYVSTYLERDVRGLHDVREMAEFGRFLALAAAWTGRELNASQFGRDAGVSPLTARRWLDVLAASYQWLELAPYHGNAVKRLSGKRKGHLRDTGLACFLQRLSSPDALAASPLLGSLFETWAVLDIHRQFVDLSLPPQAYHWRTSGGAEVDLLLEIDGKFYPIEVKCSTTISGHDLRGMRAFRDTYPHLRVMTGLIIYAGEKCYRVDPQTVALPWNAAAA